MPVRRQYATYSTLVSCQLLSNETTRKHTYITARNEDTLIVPLGGAAPASLGDVTGVGDFVWLDARVIAAPSEAGDGAAAAEATDGGEATAVGAAAVVGGALERAPPSDRVREQGKWKERGGGERGEIVVSQVYELLQI